MGICLCNEVRHILFAILLNQDIQSRHIDLSVCSLEPHQVVIDILLSGEVKGFIESAARILQLQDQSLGCLFRELLL